MRGAHKTTRPSQGGPCCARKDVGLDVGVDVREDVPDRRAEQGQNNDHDDSHQNENQRIFDQALAFLTRQIQHDNHPFQNLNFQQFAELKIIYHSDQSETIGLRYHLIKKEMSKTRSKTHKSIWAFAEVP